MIFRNKLIFSIEIGIFSIISLLCNFLHLIMIHSTIQTAQNVSIHQPLATVPDRIFAYLIDMLVIIGVYILIILLWNGFDGSNMESFSFILLISLPIFFYDLLWETFNQGQSIGKMALKIRVVNIDGTKVPFSALLIRWLLRPVDVSFSSGGIAIIAILVTSTGQRLGDIAAKTKVITERNTIQLDQLQKVQVPDNYVPVYPQVSVFSDEDIQKVNRIYLKARALREHKLILKLAVKLSQEMKVNLDNTKPLDFVGQVISDYHYYALRS